MRALQLMTYALYSLPLGYVKWGGRGGRAAPENGEQRTENRTPGKRATGETRGESVEGLPCGADTKDTKNHEGTRRTARMGNRRLRRLEPIRGRLPPAGLPE